jgi:hypothetical protein
MARLCARRFCSLSALTCVIWGVAVLVIRQLLHSNEFLLWPVVALPLVVVLSWIWAKRRCPTDAVVRALLDARCRMGGLLMADGEIDLGNWRKSMCETPLPAVRWLWGRSLIILLAASAFVLAAFLMPQRFFTGLGQPGNRAIDTQVAQLAKQIELLKDEKLLTPEKAQAMDKSLEQAKAQATSDDPAKTLEAMDHLGQIIAQTAQQAAQDAAQDAKKEDQASQLAQAIQKASQGMSPEALGEAMKELSKMTQEAAAQDAALAQATKGELGDAIDKSQLTPQQLADLAKALKDASGEHLDQLQHLAQAGLASEDSFEACKATCEGDDPGALAQALAGCQGEGDIAAAIDSASGLPGRGGTSRGPGAAALTWKDASNADNVTFKETPLSPSAISSMKDTVRLGISAADPTKKDNAGGESVGGSLNGAGGAGAAYKQMLLPRHRQAVEQYFDREKKLRDAQPAP